MPSQPGIFDVANQSRRAVMIRNLTAVFVGFLIMAGFFCAAIFDFVGILWNHLGWTILAGLVFLVLFPLVTYVVILSLGGHFGILGFLLGTVLLLVVFFLRIAAYRVIHGHRKLPANWRKGEHAEDAAGEGLIGGSPSKKTGFWSLPLRVGAGGSSGGGGGSKGGGRFGAVGRY